MIIGLDQIGKSKLSQCGAKAHNLARCLHACDMLSGIHFPQSVVLTCNETRKFYNERKHEKSTTLNRLFSVFEGNSLIVRSSSINEDSKLFSAAGQYETYMNLKDKESVSSAIESIFRSENSESAQLYKKIYGVNVNSADHDMAILVQEMIKCDCSGVLYTLNPIDETKEMLIEYSYGFGDRVAAGTINAQTFKLESGTSSSFQLLKDDKIDQSIQLLKKAAELLTRTFDSALDIEWGISNGALYIFQARPMFKCTSVPWDKHFAYRLIPNAITGDSISTGIAIGKFEDKDIKILKNKKVYKNVAEIVRNNAILLLEGGLLSHISSLARELSVPCIKRADSMVYNEVFWVVNGYSAQLLKWSQIENRFKGHYLWEAFWHIARNQNYEMQKNRGIIKTEINSKFEAVVFEYDLDCLNRMLSEVSCEVSDHIQRSVTYDIEDNCLIDKGIILRSQSTDDYLRIQIKIASRFQEHFRKDSEILLYFSSTTEIEEFIKKYPVHVTGAQRRRRKSYAVHDGIINIIEWANCKPYLSIESTKPQGIFNICTLLDIEYNVLKCVDGKEIFQYYGLDLKDCWEDENA